MLIMSGAAAVGCGFSTMVAARPIVWGEGALDDLILLFRELAESTLDLVALPSSGNRLPPFEECCRGLECTLPTLLPAWE